MSADGGKLAGLLHQFAPVESTKRTNYIFVDYENVQELDLNLISGKPVRVILVLGERHKNLPLELVKQLHRFAAQVKLVETGRSGKNALDLVLALCLGEAKKADPHGYFHILSRDKDFDALIHHLKIQGALAARHGAFSEIKVLMTKVERVNWLCEHFKVAQTNRPKKRKTLESHIQAQFGKALSASELEETINGLIAVKTISFTAKDEVAYCK